MSKDTKDDGAVARLIHMINEARNWKQLDKPKIRVVDEQLRQVNEKDYEPEIVSIGPIHRGKYRLTEMEQHKARYLGNILQRRPIIGIQEYLEILRRIEEPAREYYTNNASHLKSDEFVVMLLLDGCFVIELVRKYWFEDDPLFDSDYTLCRIRRDLLLLENQLPFFVLNLLFDMTKTNDPEDDLQYLFLVFVSDILPWTGALKTYSKSDSPPDAEHLLGLIHQSCFSFSTTKNLTSEKDGYQGNKNLFQRRSATELREAGIRLIVSKGNNNNNNNNNILDATFFGGALRLPSMHVSYYTESLLRNLIAFELRLTSDHPKLVTDYTFLMSCLVNSGKDVAILRRHGILNNFLGGGDDMVCSMVNRLGNNVLRPSRLYYSDVFESVSRRPGLLPPRKVWMAKLRKNYSSVHKLICVWFH